MGDVREFDEHREIRVSARELDMDDIKQLDPIMERIEDALRAARDDVLRKSSGNATLIIRVLPK